MSRSTHPRPRAKHDRGHARFHRDRVVAARQAELRRLEPIGHPMGYRRHLPDGRLEDRQAYYGCPGSCLMCRPWKVEPWRTRDKRAWREAVQR